MSLAELASRASFEGSRRAAARLDLLDRLKHAHYRFVTSSVATHRRILRREEKAVGGDLRDVFGWSLPFPQHLFEPGLIDCMERAGVLTPSGGLLRSTIRAATLGQDIFLHSAFPSDEPDAVFFGPDSYRFANFLTEELRDAPGGGVLVDIGAGSGVGGVVAAHLARPNQVILTDVNPKALDLAGTNAASAGVHARLVLCDGLAEVGEGLDLVVANPPFIAGEGGRTYRDGGDLHGMRVSLDWAVCAARKLAPGGRLLLYTGSAIIAGEDPFRMAIEAELAGRGFKMSYREIDPDIFGGQLSAPAYRDAERIAAVGLRIERI